MEFNALVWAKAQDGRWHRGTVISRQEKEDLRFIKVRFTMCTCMSIYSATVLVCQAFLLVQL